MNKVKKKNKIIYILILKTYKKTTEKYKFSKKNKKIKEKYIENICAKNIYNLSGFIL